MKKIFAKELAALAVLALAFTGCNTAFEGTNANFSEKEAQYTDRSGATQTATSVGGITHTGSINNTNKKNVIDVTITSFSKINVESADKAIHFQQLTNNSTAGYYPIRGADLPKTRIKVDEGTGTGTFNTTITYEVDGTGVTANKVALFVDAKELKTKGGTAVLALDNNTKRGEESDSYIDYLSTNATTTIIAGQEDFRPTYAPTGSFATPVALSDASGKATGVYRFAVSANNKKNTFQAGAADDYESGLAAKLNDAVVIYYRKPGSRTYAEKKLSWTYHEATSTNIATDPYAAHTYTADFDFAANAEIGTEWRAVLTNPDGLVAPAWYKDVYNHPAIVYGAGQGVGAKISAGTGAYNLHKTIPSYIVVSPALATAGTNSTSTYNPTSFTKANIRSTQADYFTVTTNDNWFQVSPSTASVRDDLDPATTKDFIVVDANNKKIAADVEVITYSYNDSTALSGKVNYVKVTVKDVRYRNSLTGLKVCVGEGTKLKENKTYPDQKSFGVWKDVTDDDYAGYVALN